MKTLFRHSIDVAIERRRRYVVGVVREVGRGDGSDGRLPSGFCSVQLTGEAAGGKRAVLTAMLPVWSSGIGVQIEPDDYVLLLLGSQAGELAMVVWRFPGESDGRLVELTNADRPASRSITSKAEVSP